MCFFTIKLFYPTLIFVRKALSYSVNEALNRAALRESEKCFDETATGSSAVGRTIG